MPRSQLNFRAAAGASLARRWPSKAALPWLLLALAENDELRLALWSNFTGPAVEPFTDDVGATSAAEQERSEVVALLLTTGRHRHHRSCTRRRTLGQGSVAISQAWRNPHKSCRAELFGKSGSASSRAPGGADPHSVGKPKQRTGDREAPHDRQPQRFPRRMPFGDHRRGQPGQQQPHHHPRNAEHEQRQPRVEAVAPSTEG